MTVSQSQKMSPICDAINIFKNNLMAIRVIAHFKIPTFDLVPGGAFL